MSKKNKALLKLSSLLKEKASLILRENAKDVQALPKTTASAYVDRLTLNLVRIENMCESLDEVAKLSDPVGEISETKTLANGLRASRLRSPLGVIFMIFESRPNVAVESFSLAFKAGNAVILRGGKESKHTTAVLYRLMRDSLRAASLSESCLWGITDYDRSITQTLLKEKDFIDVVVPRGGDGLINAVVNQSLIPIIKNDRGLCHVYVHDDADLKAAVEIIVNAKTSRPGVCNSIETILVRKEIASELLALLYPRLDEFGVIWYCDSKALKILKGKKNVKKAVAKSWATEYLDFKLNCRVVESLDEALAHIEEFGSHHSEAICTSSSEAMQRFQNEVDAAAVYTNASTRFTDGFALGLGGELGISTQKIHVRGPVGLKELPSLRWIINGAGQIRK